MGRTGKRSTDRAWVRPFALALMALVAALALPAIAFGHLERPSYWPDPAVDKSVKGGAGGAVPKALSLKSAVNEKGQATPTSPARAARVRPR